MCRGSCGVWSEAKDLVVGAWIVGSPAKLGRHMRPDLGLKLLQSLGRAHLRVDAAGKALAPLSERVLDGERRVHPPVIVPVLPWNPSAGIQ